MSVIEIRPLRAAIAAALFAAAMAASGIVSAQTDAGTLDKESAARVDSRRPYSPYADRNFPTRPLFGDTHVHTADLRLFCAFTRENTSLWTGVQYRHNCRSIAHKVPKSRTRLCRC